MRARHVIVIPGVIPGRFALLLASAGLLLALTGIGLFEQHEDRLAGFVAVALAQGAVYLLATLLAWHGRSSRRVLILVLGIAAAMRLGALIAPPYLSDDIYRYIWDGRVLTAGVNPYRYIPTDPHLAALRDDAIFPRINRNNYAPTIYPPVAQAIFFAATHIGESVTVMKAAMIAFDAVTIALLYRLLTGAGQPTARLLIYAWHPLPVWEFAGSGHIDAALVALVVLALWCAQRRRDRLAGLALAAATLVKLYPAVLLPALYRRWEGRLLIPFVAGLVIAYLPFLGVGWGVLGFLPGYAAEEGFTGSGSGFYLWSLIGTVLPLATVPALAYIALAALLLGTFAAFVLLADGGRDRFLAGAALLATAFTVLLSPHYAWYFAWLIPFGCLLPSLSLLWLTLVSFVLYLVPVGSHLVRDSHRLLVESLLYAPFAVLALIEFWRFRRREQLTHGTSASG
jgi:alpha-1,6-mannosyltransferase